MISRTAPPAVLTRVPRCPARCQGVLARPFHMQEFAVSQSAHTDPRYTRVVAVCAMSAQATPQPMAP